MIDLYYWNTPNGYKVLMALEELGLPFQRYPVDIGAGEQFAPEFLEISPNNRIPAIIDHAVDPDTVIDGTDKSLPIFESGAILLHLAEKTGELLPDNASDRSAAIQWLFWQMGGLGPMLGQYFHFTNHPTEKIIYAVERYRTESLRLLTVLDTRLKDREYLAGEYSIADIACYPWILVTPGLDIDLAEFPKVERWMQSIKARPATSAAYQVGEPAKRQAA